MAQHVTIVGGGLAGASLACALEPLDIDITVLEATPFDDEAQPSFDERTIALTFSSRRVLDGIGIWPQIAAQAGPIHRIHISNRGHGGITRLDRRLIGTEALGYVIPSRVLGKALTTHLSESNRIDYRCPANAQRLQVQSEQRRVQVDTSDQSIDSDLVVIADGGRSPLSQLAGLNTNETTYDEQALVGTVGVDRDQDHTAYERFTRHGPLALLPLDRRRFALAWTLPADEARDIQALSQSDFLEKLQEVFGDRLGFFTRCDSLKVYPLRRADMAEPVSDRVVALGNAAHVVHPVAGQGFNLGLRDVAQLAEELAQALADGNDIGNPAVLAGYARSRRSQTRRVLHFTDGLLRIFPNETLGARLARNIGLSTLEVLPPAKRILLKRTAGLAGTLPRLARGLPLSTN